jgi:hypothetical protein
MRAFLIDPEVRTISEIDFVGGNRKIQRILGCKAFTTGSRPLNGSLSKGFDALLASDDPLEDHDDAQDWFQVDADRYPPSSFPLTGKGLVLGADENGVSRAASISLEELTRRITFTRRKFRGYETEVTPGKFVVTLTAPIIEEN